MSRWIDADALKARIDQEVKEDKVLDGWAFFFKAYLDEAPSIDIVRCKECKWHHYDTDDECRWRIEEIPKDDDFCSYGERREG